MEKLAFVGFGEAAGAIAGSVARDGLGLLAGFDIKPGLEPRMRAAAVEPCADRAAALEGAGAVWCLVTADRAEAAAAECAPFLAPGTFWLDGNSCAPQTKRRAAAHIGGAGARYVDVAIMAPVLPLRAKVPLLLAGPHAEAAAGFLWDLAMTPSVAGPEIGQATLVKMLRSVLVKGIEALTAESLLAARRAGVEGSVLELLGRSDPGVDWPARAAYALERMARHGTRRAAEMQEVVATLAGLGMPARLSEAAALWQGEIGALGLAPGAGMGEGASARAEAVLRGLEARGFLDPAPEAAPGTGENGAS